MSEYVLTKTVFLDGACLMQALSDLKYEHEFHPEGARLSGYQGDLRDQTAQIIIRREHVGAASNDVGFRRNGSAFEAVVSEFDRRHTFTDAKLGLLTQAYNRRLLDRMSVHPGRRISKEERTPDGRIVLHLTRY